VNCNFLGFNASLENSSFRYWKEDSEEDREKRQNLTCAIFRDEEKLVNEWGHNYYDTEILHIHEGPNDAFTSWTNSFSVCCHLCSRSLNLHLSALFFCSLYNSTARSYSTACELVSRELKACL